MLQVPGQKFNHCKPLIPIAEIIKKPYEFSHMACLFSQKYQLMVNFTHPDPGTEF